MNPYDSAFYSNEHETSAAGARAILPAVIERYKPRTLIDVGCGTGAWCVEAARLGVTNATGIDGPWVQEAGALAPGLLVDWHFIARDLCSSLPAAFQPWGIALCLEVAEHLPPERAPGLVADLCALSPIVLWSAAVPGQGGEGHINEQPEEYWERLFAAHGRRSNRWIRGCVAADPRVPIWYRRNIMIYEAD